MRGLAILLGFNLLGYLLQSAGVPLPGNVIGLILFTACLFTGLVKLRWVEESAQFLLRHMLLFFAPAIVIAVPRLAALRPQWAAVTAGLVGSLLVVLLVTGWVATWLIPRAEQEVERGTVRGMAGLIPSPLYSGERVRVRGRRSRRGYPSGSNEGPSPPPSPPSTGERE